jgi:hypothetical protein
MIYCPVLVDKRRRYSYHSFNTLGGWSTSLHLFLLLYSFSTRLQCSTEPLMPLLMPLVAVLPRCCYHPLCSSHTGALRLFHNPLSRRSLCLASKLFSSCKTAIMIDGKCYRSLMSPYATAGTALSPPQVSSSLRPQRRINNLAKCLVANFPTDVTYPSLGQVGEEVKRASTFLDLYRARAREDASLNKVKSPTPRENEADWQTFDGVLGMATPTGTTTELRRRRSQAHMKWRSAIVSDTRVSANMDDILVQPSEPSTAIHDLTTTNNASRNICFKDAKTVLDSDARKRVELRKRYKTRPPALELAPILRPPALSLPSPPLSSTLLKVKSPLPLAVRTTPRRLPQPPAPAVPRRLPRPPVILAAPKNRTPSIKAPYWVKKVPKTPRTMRTERRHGWGGSWDMAGIAQVVDQLKEA